MSQWLPDVCSQLHGEIISIYWMMILPLVVILIVLELFKTQGQSPDGGKILVRVLTSVFLLVSFKETINLIALVGDGVADKIDGLAKMPEILEIFSNNFSRDAPSLYKVRELFIFLLNFVSYFLAYFGIFITEALIKFGWAVLYICAPLMILCYIPQGTSGICKNLYKGLLTIVSWKIMYSILGVLLLKLAVEKTSLESDNIITTSIINLCIALAILLVPLFTKSLIGDGISSFVSGIAAAPGVAAMGVGKAVLSAPVTKGADLVKSKFKNNLNLTKGGAKDQKANVNSKVPSVDHKKSAKFIKNK